jgi:hypothetical protein
VWASVEVATLAVCLLSAFFLHRYVLDPNYFHMADDWGWLHLVHFHPIPAYVSWLPKMLYNDRPVGALFLRELHLAFGLAVVPMHAVLLALHLGNAVLVYLIAKRLWPGKVIPALVAAGLFAHSFSVTHTMLTVGTIFDLLGNTMVLATVFCHLGRGWPSRLLTVVFAFLAVRTKEVGIMLPPILLVYDWCILLAAQPIRNRWWKTLRRDGLLLGLFIVMVLVYLPLFRGTRLPYSDPYAMHVTVPVLIATLRQIGSELLLNRLPFSTGLTWAVLGVSLLLAVRNHRFGWLLAATLLALLPTAFLEIQRKMLYFYIPSSFFWLSVAALLAPIVHRLEPRRPAGKITAILITALIIMLVGRTIKFSDYYRDRVAWLLRYGQQYRQEFTTFRQAVPTLPPGTLVVLENFPVYFNVFDYGPCYALRLAYDTQNVVCSLYQSPAVINEQIKKYPHVIRVRYTGYN